MTIGFKRISGPSERRLFGRHIFFWLFRHGLTGQEWLYFRSFLLALKCGEYDELDDEYDELDDEEER